MKILAISPRIPEQDKKGDQVLSFHRLSYLAKSHQIKLICFGDLRKDLKAKENLESIGINVELIKFRKIWAFWHLISSIINSKIPFQCAIYRSRLFKNAVDSALDKFQPNAIYVVTVRALLNFKAYQIPTFIDLVDSMALNFSRRIEASKGIIKFLLSVEYRRIQQFERMATWSATHCFVVSSIDQKIIASDNVSVIPLGVDGRFFVQKKDYMKYPSLIFTGNMNYQPNIDAILWFYKYCWASLKAAFPNCRLVIAGSNPVRQLLALQMDKSVTVTGYVDSIAAEISCAQVSIAPMQSGSGMQFKILEAMACGIPVVTTSLGAGDILAKPGRDFLMADTPELYIQHISSLLRSNALRVRIGNSGREFVLRCHTWKAVNESFEMQCCRLMVNSGAYVLDK